MAVYSDDAGWTLAELRWCLRQWVANSIAGHRLVPRSLRHRLYHLVGIPIEAIDVSSFVRIVGGADLRIGAGTSVSPGVSFDAAGRITIGADCVIDADVRILSVSRRLGAKRWFNEIRYVPVVIGDRVWLEAGVTVQPGSVIPAGCVVQSGAIVSGTLPEPGVYAGSPATLVRSFRPAS